MHAIGCEWLPAGFYWLPGDTHITIVVMDDNQLCIWSNVQVSFENFIYSNLWKYWPTFKVSILLYLLQQAMQWVFFTLSIYPSMALLYFPLNLIFIFFRQETPFTLNCFQTKNIYYHILFTFPSCYLINGTIENLTFTNSFGEVIFSSLKLIEQTYKLCANLPWGRILSLSQVGVG